MKFYPYKKKRGGGGREFQPCLKGGGAQFEVLLLREFYPVLRGGGGGRGPHKKESFKQLQRSIPMGG